MGCSHCSRRFTRLHQNFRDEQSLLHATSLISFGLRYAHSLFTVAVQVNRTVATVQQRVRSTDTPPFPPIPPPSFLPSFLPSHPPSSLGLTHSASICPRALRQKHSSRRSLSNELDGCNCRSFVRRTQDTRCLLATRPPGAPGTRAPTATRRPTGATSRGTLASTLRIRPPSVSEIRSLNAVTMLKMLNLSLCDLYNMCQYEISTYLIFSLRFLSQINN